MSGVFYLCKKFWILISVDIFSGKNMHYIALSLCILNELNINAPKCVICCTFCFPIRFVGDEHLVNLSGKLYALAREYYPLRIWANFLTQF
jgi:hypothetical protein